MSNLENNKLIAEFMGVHEIMHDGYSEYDFDDNTLDVVHQKHLQYHNSWDWLMPVVEKIESLNFEIDGVVTSADVHIVYGGCRIVDEDGSGLFEFYSHSTDKLGATYKAVVEFIKWYNQKQY